MIHAHNTEKKDEDDSIGGKIVALFDIDKDPLIQKFKKKQEEKEMEEAKTKKGKWYFTH